MVLSNGAELRDYQIEMGINHGVLKPDACLEYKLGAEAIGGLKFVKEHNFVHGWFYVGSNNYSALWDQVRTSGNADCTIQLGLELMATEGGDRFSIDDYSIRFVRPEERRGLFARVLRR